MAADLPDTLEELVDIAEEKETLACETCGEDVERRWLEDGSASAVRKVPVSMPPRFDQAREVKRVD